jgi:alkylation response protein AidB-like acyl-CoA dehydrogenase
MQTELDVSGGGLDAETRREIIELAKSIARKDIAPRALEIAHSHEYPQEIFEVFRDCGLFALFFPSKWGGLDADLQTCCDVVEAIATVCNTSASLLIAQAFGGLPILVAGNDEQRQEYLPGIASGQLRCAMAMTEPIAGSDPAGIRTLARKTADGYVLNGQKCFITLANIADVITVYAKLEPGRSTSRIQGFLVPGGTQGLRIGRLEEKMGATAIATCEVFLEDCFVPDSAVMGAPGTGFRVAMQVFERVRPIIGARSVGIAQGAFDVAVAHIQERHAFEQPLAAKQGLQFMVAEMATAIEASRGLVRRACEAIDGNDPLAGRYAAMAKLFATDSAMRVTTDAVQLLGGYGFLTDYPTAHRMREAKLGQIVEGTSEIQKVVIARSYLGDAARPELRRQNGQNR